uniref:Uncharacterized protein n=1 Tax=Rhizophora mucronata TaxID=61149 RepID=A0A2P2N2P8_RHIMU
MGSIYRPSFDFSKSRFPQSFPK